MCKFDKAWIGTCKEENATGKEYCEEHIKEVCSVCGGQATHNCAETMQFVCGTNLCGKLECKLQHFYRAHGYAFFELRSLEEKLNRTPFKLVVASVYYGTENEIDVWLNEEYKDRLEVLLITHDEENNMKIYRSHFRYYVKHKEEIPELFQNSWYQEEVSKRGVYYSDKAIPIKEPFTTDMLNALEKVMGEEKTT
ncbi:hypothetical protein CVD28_01725 [Bacillus sp. M6-12]|uniref:hypothetical protein n=1 Tax=Bacillus sp. M6-12 TaxID=2054166 RepID=UPI000C760F7C|nr:hypothetical protein [Bacillus sp. M6-12]PLS19153.1 hypothetical protein CVD28_01725 [Bacillus sp. M6-12]